MLPHPLSVVKLVYFASTQTFTLLVCMLLWELALPPQMFTLQTIDIEFSYGK